MIKTVRPLSHFAGPVGAALRVGALAAATGITYSIVWALGAYAYGESSAEALPQTVTRANQGKSCS